VKRWLITIVICLVAGATLDVAVAWGCATWAPTHPEPLPEDRAALEGWLTRNFSDWGARTRRRTAMGLGLVKSATETWTEHTAAPPSDEYLHGIESRSDLQVEHRCGWPLATLKGSVRWSVVKCVLTSHYLGEATTRSITTSDPPQFQALVRLPSSRRPDPLPPAITVADANRYLPFKPIWGGFAVNTLLYAASLWLLLHGPLALCRLIRWRRGLCPRCAYPMGESATCTECGKQLPKRTVTS
jgi:hypothetical protein